MVRPSSIARLEALGPCIRWEFRLIKKYGKVLKTVLAIIFLCTKARSLLEEGRNYQQIRFDVRGALDL